MKILTKSTLLKKNSNVGVQDITVCVCMYMPN